MRLTFGRVVAALATTALVGLGQAGVASADAGGVANGGNSGNAHVCQNWQTLLASDGSAFTSQDQCASYGAQGGTLLPYGQAKADCEAFGGTFTVDNPPDAPSPSFLWHCRNIPANNLSQETPIQQALFSDCFAEGGNGAGIGYAGSFPTVFNADCGIGIA